MERGRPRTRTVDDRSDTVVCMATLEVDAVIETDSAGWNIDLDAEIAATSRVVPRATSGFESEALDRRSAMGHAPGAVPESP